MRKINKFNVYPNKTLKDRVDEITLDSDKNSVGFPYEFNLYDTDLEINNYFKEGKGRVETEDGIIPAFFLSSERWSQLTKTWTLMDVNKNVLRPYITIKRLNDEKGTRLDTFATIPQQSIHQYYKVPVFDGDKVGYDIYKVVQPTNIDLKYEITLFSNYLTEINVFTEKMYFLFNSTQAYIQVYGNYIPMVMESMSQEKTMQNPDDENFYIKKLTLKVKTFIQKKENFEIVSSVRRTSTSIELEEPVKITGSTVNFNVDKEIDNFNKRQQILKR